MSEFHGSRALALLPWFLASAPLVVVPGLADFARFPQQAFIQTFAVFLVLVWALERHGAEPRTERMRLLDVPAGLFLGLSLLSVAGASDRAAGLQLGAHWVSCALVYAMVSRLVARPAQARPLLAGMFGGAVAVAVTGLGQALFQSDWIPSAVGPAGTLANRNVAAGYLVMVLPFGLALWRSSGPRGRRAVVAGAAVILLFLPFTLARVAAVALALQLLVLQPTGPTRPGRDVPRRGPNRWWVRRMAPTLAAVALMVAAAGLTLASPAKARSLSIRGSLAQAALSMARENPVLGLGLGSFGDQYMRFGEPIRVSTSSTPLRVESAHNEPLHVLAETGLLTTMVLLWIIGSTVAALARLRRSPDPQVRTLAWALGLALVGLAADGAFGFPLRTGVGPLGAAVLLGLVAALEAHERRRALPRARDVGVGGARSVVLATLVVVVLVPAVAWSVHRQATPPVPQPTSSGHTECSPAVDLRVRADNRLDLVATDAPVGEVLDCLADRTGLRLEVDGPPPRQRVSATFVDEALAKIVEQLLTGLGVDYLLAFDPSGARLERLILVEASSPAARPAPRPRPRPAAVPSTSDWDEEADPGAFPGPGPPTRGPADSGPGSFFAPGGEPLDPYGEPGSGDYDPAYAPEPMGPGELSPMTLRRPSIQLPTMELVRSATHRSGR